MLKPGSALEELWGRVALLPSHLTARIGNDGKARLAQGRLVNALIMEAKGSLGEGDGCSRIPVQNGTLGRRPRQCQDTVDIGKGIGEELVSMPVPFEH